MNPDDRNLIAVSLRHISYEVESADAQEIDAVADLLRAFRVRRPHWAAITEALAVCEDDEIRRNQERGL
jgi:hypothetical protein